MLLSVTLQTQVHRNSEKKETIQRNNCLDIFFIRNRIANKEIVNRRDNRRNINSIYILNETSELNKDKNNNEHDNIAQRTPFL